MDGIIPGFLRIELWTSAIEAAVSLAIIFYSWKMYRTTASFSALALNLSFTMLLAADLIYGSTVLSTIIPPGFRTASQTAEASLRVMYGYLMRIGLEIAAYLTLGIVSIHSRRPQPFILALVIGLGQIGVRPFIPLGELLVTAVLIFVCGIYAVNLYERRSPNSLLVFSAFLLITLSHASLVPAPIPGFLYLTSHIFEITGFLCFLASLLLSLYPRRGRRTVEPKG